MTAVTLSIIPADAGSFSAQLREELAWADVPGMKGALPSALTVNVETLADCERVAAAVVRWLDTTGASFWLDVSGPAAEGELRMLRGEYVKDMLIGFLDTSASVTGLPAK